MKLSPLFKYLSYSGCWRPVTWTSPVKIVLYNSYTIFFIFSSVAYVVSEIGSLLTVENIDKFVDNTYILVILLAGCGKAMNMLLYRREIINLINVFLEEPCATSNSEEAAIQLLWDNRLRRNGSRYATIIEVDAVLAILALLMNNFRHGKLPYTAWIPYNYTSSIVFSLTFTYQMLYGEIMLRMAHVATDILYVGILMQICCQFEILLARLNNMTRNNKVTIDRIIRHHNCIYQ